MNLSEKVKYVVLMVFILAFSYYNIGFADVGSFESYDSGSSRSSSRSYSSGWVSGMHHSSDGSGGSLSIGGLIFLIAIVSIAIVQNKNNRKRVSKEAEEFRRESEKKVEDGIKAVDPMFNKEEFLFFARSTFVKLQEAWITKDWSVIRMFESNELFEQHKNQLQRFIDDNQINKMRGNCIKSVSLYSFSQTGDTDILKVTLSSKINYRLTFIRKAGIKTKDNESEVNTTNCPNCGAPSQCISSGKCEYCGSVITTAEHNWVLSELMKI